MIDENVDRVARHAHDVGVAGDQPAVDRRHEHHRLLLAHRVEVRVRAAGGHRIELEDRPHGFDGIGAPHGVMAPHGHAANVSPRDVPSSPSHWLARAGTRWLRRLEGKVALVTGGASGIGEGTVRRFVAEGAQVVIADRQADAGAALAEGSGRPRASPATDVTEEADVAGRRRRRRRRRSAGST